ncbi:MAG: winged helix DNA-binding domain-containing protein [Spirosomataceae bacterium]
MNIPQQRLNNQQITKTNFTTPNEVAAHLGAVQAQDYAMSKWAIGVRLPGATDDSVEQAINEGSVIRTHILRPTWHLAAAQDIRWMLALTAPHVRQSVSYMYRQLELNDTVLNRTETIIAKALEGNNHLTRAELMTELEKEGINTSDLRSSHLMFHVELNGMVCNGAMRGKQITYALMDERVPSAKALAREEALAELAKRYFRSHGPATLPDFVWWSGLKVSDAKAGLEMIKSDLVSEKIGEQIYWFPNHFHPESESNVHLLPAFDEFMVSYKDRTASLSSEHHQSAITGNGIFKPIVVVDGKVEGVWKRTVQKGKVGVETSHFSNPVEKTALTAAIQRYARFLGKEI